MQGRALVAFNLKRLRLAKGISQESLAVDADVNRTYVSDIERGLGNVTVDILDKMAAVLECGIAEFFQAL